MAINKNITMKQYNGTDYDTLYPKTIAEQVDGVYNKEQVLKDATAALFGLGSSAVPDDIFAAIGKYKQYWWRRRVPAGVRYVEVRTDMSSTAYLCYEKDNDYCDIAKSITINQSTGEITLNDPETILPPTTYAEAKSLVVEIWNKRPFYAVIKDSSNIRYVPENATYTTDYITTTHTLSVAKEDEDGYNGIYLNAPANGVKGQTVTSQLQNVSASDWQYIQSSNRNAYPDSGTQDGYEYEYLGVPFDNAVTAPKIEVGSYVGTGTYGQDNPNTLTFGFVPKLVIISIPGDYRGICWTYGKTGMLSFEAGNLNITSSRDAETLTWYSDSASRQYNIENLTYYYFAIG